MHRLRLDTGGQNLQANLDLAKVQEQTPDIPLRDFLAQFPGIRSAEPIPDEWLSLPLRTFDIDFVTIRAAGVTVPIAPATPATPEQEPPATTEPPAAPPAPPPQPGPDLRFPAALDDSEAVRRAYATEISDIARYLSNDLSVLVVCDKVLVEHIYRHAVRESSKEARLEDDAASSGDEQSEQGNKSGALFQRDVASASSRIAGIGRVLAGIKPTQVLVLRHLDVLAGGGSEGHLSPEARMLTEVLYRSQEFIPTLLGFSDPSLGLPKVIADRFAIRVELAGLSRDVVPHLMTATERDRFEEFDQETLFKNVSGFNAIQLRNAMRYLKVSSQPGTPTRKLMELIRVFKRGSSEEVEIPDISFNDIGGYLHVKQQLFEAIELITGKPLPMSADGRPTAPPAPQMSQQESEAQREDDRRLAPRGFIFYGPPGTGKTLFAKAVANAMNATIQMISGPEIMDMWVGKSESNLRRIFAIARRNAPAVIFFDEFDSIAAQRSGHAIGGDRASNAVVAQLLTELDGFRAEQDILVIGTTNRLDIIDEALLRPSRFQAVEISLPDAQARRQIARIHAQKFKVELADDAGLLDLIVEYTDEFNGDEIRKIFQEIALQKRRGEAVTPEAFGKQIGLIRKQRDERQVSHVGGVGAYRRR